MSILVIIAILLSFPALAQEPKVDSSYITRNIRQQMFLLDYLKVNKPESPPKLPEEVDAYITAAEAAWAGEVEKEKPHMGRLNPYVVQWLLHSAYNGSEPPEEAECYTYVKYAISAFLADFEVYSQIDPAHAPLISWGYDWVGGSLSLKCDIGKEQWEKLTTAFDLAPSLFQKYIDTEAYSDKRFASQIRQAQQFFKRNGPLYTIRAAIYLGELNEAFAKLAAATTQGYESYYILPLGEALWRAYIMEEKTDHALATLDLLAQTLTAGDLSRATLLEWYTKVDPKRGSKLFELSTASAPSTLVLSEERAVLNGSYTNILTDDSFDLADLKGKFVLFDFWATWCSPCITEIPEISAFEAEYGDRITIISVNADAVTGGKEPDGVRDFMDEHKVDYTVLYDEIGNSLAALFGVTGYPAKFLISLDGMLLIHPSGGRRTVKLNEVKLYIDGLF